jgi:hypothetical protein
MFECDEDKLSGNIEMDDAYWKGTAIGGKRGCCAQKKRFF